MGLDTGCLVNPPRLVLPRRVIDDADVVLYYCLVCLQNKTVVVDGDYFSRCTDLLYFTVEGEIVR